MFDHEALEFKRGSGGREKQGKEVSGGKNESGKKNLRLQTVPFIAKQSHSLPNSPIHYRNEWTFCTNSILTHL